LRDSLDSAHSIGPVERVLNLLTRFDAQRDGMSLTELAHQANLAPSTASRFLKLLEQHEYIRRGPDRLYRLGPQIIHLGLIALRSMSLL
jgi:DNA-binding IclR family transcriptional regulator